MKRTELPKEFPALKARIRKAGFTIKAIANQIGENPQYLGSKLNGYARISAEQLDQIESCLVAVNK